MCSLSLPVIAIEGAEEFESVSSQNSVEETVENDADTVPTTQITDTRFKKPVSKKKLAKKFIIAMLCVAGTSIFLYGTLSVYNKLRDSISGQDVTLKEGEKPLDSPTDLTEAVKTFVDKTRWE